ncbi:hypothetical protein A8C56_15600 [Niabella ginsenosidivorans]|uniref:RDD domain-containing protein n=1 Tax=Niabella ginsenosidivorans TaxID=1176587 RepID=A0A1A9IAB8_9BACT|nr:hypothetical protein A8C56_15600 [Niabella ginsenosidivorans]
MFNEPLLPAQYGSFWERLGAYIIDAIVVGIPTNIIASVLGLGATMRSIDPATGAVSEGFWAMYSSFLLVSIAISWLYFALMESSEKQATLGKMALRLKVTDMNGQRISFLNATGRYFAKVLSGLILLIGYLMVLWDDKRQALHDKLAGTLVVKK